MFSPFYTMTKINANNAYMITAKIFWCEIIKISPSLSVIPSNIYRDLIENSHKINLVKISLPEN